MQKKIRKLLRKLIILMSLFKMLFIEDFRTKLLMELVEGKIKSLIAEEMYYGKHSVTDEGRRRRE